MADECDIDELTAFLEASDDDNDEAATEVEAVKGQETQGDEFEEDLDDDALCEFDQMMAENQSTGVAGNQSKELKTQSDLGYQKVDDTETQSNGQCTDPEDLSESQSDVNQAEQEVAEDEEEAAEADKNDLIKAEMAAMAARMKQLQEMLEKKTTKQPASEKSTCTKDKTDRHKKSGSDTSKKSVYTGSSKTVNTPNLFEKMKQSSDIQNKTKPSPGQQKGSSEKLPKAERSEKKKDTSLKLLSEDAGKDNPFFRDPPRSQGVASTAGEPAPPPTSASLFGDSDDSDWDELDGDEKTKLSKEGRDLKKLITGGQRQREAHIPSYDPSILRKVSPGSGFTGLDKTRPIQSTLPTNRPERPQLNPDTGTVSGKYKVREEYRQKPATVQREDERASVTDPFCGIRIINPRISMDDFKSKMAGRAMMKIDRLTSKYGTCDLQKDNWVTMGVVVHKTEPRQSATGKAYCIWKLSDLQNCDSTVTFFLFGNVYKEHWKKELGVVIGLLNPSLMDKAEKNQNEVAMTINHPQQLLFMGVSKDLGRCRGTTKSGQPCSSFINKQQGEYCTYHVQAAYRRSSSKRTELQGSTGVTPKAFDQKKRGNSQGCFFYGGNTYTTVKPNAKSTQHKMTLNKLQSEASRRQGRVTTMSLHEIAPEGEMKLQKIKEKDKALLDLLAMPTAGAMNFVKHLVKKEDEPTTEAKPGEKVVKELMSAKDLLKQHQQQLKQAKVVSLPKLGRGFGSGQDISLDVPVKRVKGAASAELAKQLAIAKVKAKGGIEKVDPNAVKKKLTSPEAREKVKKRVAEAMDTDSNDTRTSEPPKKKSKLLGNLDLNSPEVQSLLKTKSKHTGALAEAEAEHEERYFQALEKTERMEDKMAATMEVPVTLFSCLQCKYQYFSVHERCKAENHVIKKVKGKKRFFKCKTCKTRTISTDKICTDPCKNCGGNVYERVSMLKERSGPKLESEQLCLRGNEEKFIGSLQGNSFLNV